MGQWVKTMKQSSFVFNSSSFSFPPVHQVPPVSACAAAMVDTPNISCSGSRHMTFAPRDADASAKKTRQMTSHSVGSFQNHHCYYHHPSATHSGAEESSEIMEQSQSKMGWQHWLWYRWLNSLRPSDTYMRQHNIPTLLQIMACRLFSAKQLSEPMLPYCQLDPK